LTLADLLLWHWSLAHGHEALALISGLTAPPLALVVVWLLGLQGARVLARGAKRPAARLKSRSARATRAPLPSTQARSPDHPFGPSREPAPVLIATQPTNASRQQSKAPRKLAA